MFDRFKNLLGRQSGSHGGGGKETRTAHEWAAEGRFLSRNGEPVRAIEAYQNALALDSRLSDALAGLADLYNRMGRYDEALEAFTRAVEAEPTLQDAHYQMGHIFLKRKDVRGAAQAFENELKVTPRSGRVHNDLAVAYFHLKDYARAVQHADVALAQGEYVQEKFLEALKPYRKP